MKKLIVAFLVFIPFFVLSQEDYTWWNTRHGWEPGMPSWRMFMKITPGYLGPNALPVPELKKGIIESGNKFEGGASTHFMQGDPTQDLFFNYYRSFAQNKIALEVYGVLGEHYAMSEYIRDERIARDFDGKGFANGDLYFATHVQLFKGRKFPDTMIRLACRTASGNKLEGARYSDNPGYFFDLCFSKEYLSTSNNLKFSPIVSAGFYSWQTNDDMNLQNDAYMYGVGGELKWPVWKMTNSLTGYSGYKNERDRPMVYTFDISRSLKKNALRLQYLHGFRDWTYQTIKLSFIYNLEK